MRILGLDLSITGTGLAMYAPLKWQDRPAADANLISWTWKDSFGQIDGRCIQTPADWPQPARWLHIYRNIQKFSRHADQVVLEGYSFGSHASHARALAELGGIVRFSLFMNETPYIEVAPSQLKKFVAGAATAKKDLMLKSLLKRWGFDIDNDNIGDAVGLCMIGRAMWDPEFTSDHLIKPQKEVIEALKKPKQPKKKKGRK